MFFYVYLEPEVFETAVRHGELGLQALIAILRGLLDNCFVIDFEDERGWNELGKLVHNMPDDDNRKRIKQLLGMLHRRNRLIGCILPDYVDNRSDLECLAEQAPTALLDLLLLTKISSIFDDFTYAETATLNTYQNTDFARERADIVGRGVTLVDGQLDEIVFLDRFLKKALKYAESIEICDKLFGDEYGDNFEYTAQVFFNWLEQNLADPDSCEIIIRCGVPYTGLDQMKGHLKTLKRGRLGRVTLKLFLYDNVSGAALPHHRFIVTNQVAIGIDRGMDFLNKKTHKNRNLTLDYKSGDDVDKLIGSYASGKRPEIDL